MQLVQIPEVNETVNITICITMADGVNINELSVQLTVDTVQQVCCRISEITQIPVERQQLLFVGQELKRDGRTLAQYGVAEESKLHMVSTFKNEMIVSMSV